jgi:hypothetical protein
MGYRSQVVLAISKELQPHFMAALSVCNPATVCVFNDANRFDRDYYQDGSGHWLIVWNEIKWYDSFDEIKTLQNFVEAASSDCLELGEDDGDSSENIKFVRVGEDSDDIEHRGYGFDEVAAQTSISF